MTAALDPYDCQRLTATGGEEALRIISEAHPERLDGTTSDALMQSARTALDTAQGLAHNTVMAASPPTIDGGPTN